MDINQALLYYGSDRAKQDFLLSQEAEKNKNMSIISPIEEHNLMRI